MVMLKKWEWRNWESETREEWHFVLNHHVKLKEKNVFKKTYPDSDSHCLQISFQRTYWFTCDTSVVAALFSPESLSTYWLNKIYHDNEDLRLNNIKVSKRIDNNNKKGWQRWRGSDMIGGRFWKCCAYRPRVIGDYWGAHEGGGVRQAAWLLPPAERGRR